MPTSPPPRKPSPRALLGILQPWAEVDAPIHRRLTHLIGPEGDGEVLWIGCGSGRSVIWWAQRYEGNVSGVDADPAAIEQAEVAARQVGLERRVTFQVASAVDLPHESQTFDITIMHALNLANEDLAAVMREAARVARSMSTVAALVPTWLGTATAQQAAELAAVGVTHRLGVEWKGLFRDAGIVELTLEDAATDGGWLAYGWVGLIRRGWRIGGWNGVRLAISEPIRAIRRLANDRRLGLTMIKGTRWPH